MKVILIVFSLFLGFMFYSMIRVSGNISRLEEERDRLMAMNKGTYECNQKCPFWKVDKGTFYCKLDEGECEYFNKQEVNK